MLISADLRFPRVHVLLGIGNEQGLGQVLQGSIELRDALVETPIPNLKVLPTGPVTADDEPVELLQSDRMVDVIRGCRQADVVIVDAPPIGPVADSLMLVDLLDAVILVADAQEGTRARVAEARHQLAQVGGTILGGVLNRIPESMTQPTYGSYNGRRTVNRYDDADRELAVTSRGGFQVVEDLVPRMTSSPRGTVSSVRKLRTTSVGCRTERTYPRMMSRGSSAR